MSLRYAYLDPRGRRSGPFAERDLCLLASRGLLEPEGLIEPLATDGGALESSGGAVAWKVREVEWLATLLPAPTGTPTPEIATRATLGPEGPLPPPAAAVPIAAPPSAGPVPPTAPPPSPPDPDAPSECSRATFILLSLLPAFVGVFGVGSVLIGRIGWGVAQLVLSIFTISGCISGTLALPCACIGLPLYLVLLVATVVDVITTDRDARGRRLR